MIKQCACGKKPTAFDVDSPGSKWAWFTPNCCGEWSIEGRIHYEKDPEKLHEIAVKYWNTGPRFWEPETAEAPPLPPYWRD